MSEPAAASLPNAAARPTPVRLRRNTSFRMLWIGQLLSDTGSEMGLIAYPLLILALTRSPVLAGVVGTAREISLICLQLPAGALSDRFDRRLTMIACDTVRAALLAVLGILIAADLATWPAVLLVSLIEGAAGGLFDPSAAAALPVIVPDEQLVEAWAATEGRTWAASLAGPAARRPPRRACIRLLGRGRLRRCTGRCSRAGPGHARPKGCGLTADRAGLNGSPGTTPLARPDLGTVTNVCCESSARDASTLGYRVIMVADANAAARDQDHNATLHTIYRSFGDVRPAAEVIGMIEPAAR